MRAVLPALLLAAILAAAACTDTSEPPAVKASLADSADQVMYGAHSILTDKGVMRADLTADTAFFFDDNTRIEMRTVHVTFFTSTGVRNAVLTSRQGTYNTRVGQMEARDDVLVVSQDGRRLTTEQLRYDQGNNQISSDSAFVLTQGSQRLEGVGFTSDPDMQNIRVKSRAGGAAGTFTLPGQ